MTRSKLLAGLGVLAAMLAGAAIVIGIGSGGGGGASAADKDPHSGTLTASERGRILDAVAAVTTANSHAELVARGRTIFRDPTLFKSGESCQTCHTEGAANPGIGTFHNPRPLAPPLGTGTSGFTGDRDPPALWGAAQTAPFFVDGRSPDLVTTVATTVKDHFADANNDTQAKIDNATAALVAYISQLKAPTTSFDEGTMSPAALRGEILFQGKGGCIACHGGPNFTDNHLHDTCVPRNGGNDAGAPIITSGPNANSPAGTTLAALCQGRPEPLGALINTPQLRDVKNTAPYMHDGSIPNLKAVMQFYNDSSSIAPLNLTNAEMDDLVAYMDAL